MPVSSSSRTLTATATATAASAAIALLAGCSGGSQISPSPAGQAPQGAAHAVVAQQTAHTRATRLQDLFGGKPEAFARNGFRPSAAVPAIRPAHKRWKGSVFISDYLGNQGSGVVYQFEGSVKKAKVIGTITDVQNPQGMDVDSEDNLYVTSTNGQAVNVYAANNYTATSVLSDPSAYPISVAACPNGTVYVSNVYTFGTGSQYAPGNILIYAKGATTSSGQVPDSNIYSSRYVTCDANNVLWFDYFDDYFFSAVASYDGKKVTEYGSLNIAYAGGIRATNNGQIVISDQDVGIEFFDPSNMSAGPSTTFSSYSLNMTDPVSFSFGNGDGDLFVADALAPAVDDINVKKAKLAGSYPYSFSEPEDTFALPEGNT
jgi:hypothetical protein